MRRFWGGRSYGIMTGTHHNPMTWQVLESMLDRHHALTSEAMLVCGWVLTSCWYRPGTERD